MEENRILTKTPFIEFLNKGFIKKDDSLRGQYRNYTLIIGVEWEFHQRRPGYYFQVLFNPFLKGRLLRQDECVKFNIELEEKKKRFTLNSIVKEYGQRKLFLRTEFKDIVKDVDKTIDFLKARNLEPIGFLKWANYLPDVEKHAETFVYD